MRVALIQLAASTDSEGNRTAIADRFDHLERAGADVDLVALPEGAMHDFGSPDHDLTEIAEPLDGPYVGLLAERARRLRATVVAPLFERHQGGGLPYNTLAVLGPDGDLVAAYRKIHLYDSFGYTESERLSPGPLEPVHVEVAGLRVGLLTCYDLRFPELSRLFADETADALVVPAAWVRGPLKEEQWEVLLRARAIENTMYVLATAQCGSKYIGRSLVIDPMGVVVAGAAEAEADVVTEIDPDRLRAARQRNPSLANRRLPRTPT